MFAVQTSGEGVGQTLSARRRRVLRSMPAAELLAAEKANTENKIELVTRSLSAVAQTDRRRVDRRDRTPTATLAGIGSRVAHEEVAPNSTGTVSQPLPTQLS
jgi:hypothetical protein